MLVRSVWLDISPKEARMEHVLLGRWRQELGGQLDLRIDALRQAVDAR